MELNKNVGQHKNIAGFKLCLYSQSEGIISLVLIVNKDIYKSIEVQIEQNRQDGQVSVFEDEKQQIIELLTGLQ